MRKPKRFLSLGTVNIYRPPFSLKFSTWQCIKIRPRATVTKDYLSTKRVPAKGSGGPMDLTVLFRGHDCSSCLHPSRSPLTINNSCPALRSLIYSIASLSNTCTQVGALTNSVPYITCVGNVMYDVPTRLPFLILKVRYPEVI